MFRVNARNWPRSRAQIGYLPSLCKSGWAWEALRRNESYRYAALKSGHKMVQVSEIGAGIPVYKLPGSDQAVEARVYSPVLGRFLQPDLIGEQGGMNL